MEAPGISPAKGSACGARVWHRGACPAWGGAHSRPATAHNQPELGSLHNPIYLYAKSPLLGGVHCICHLPAHKHGGAQGFWDSACPSRALGPVRSLPLLAEGRRGRRGQLSLLA